MIGQSSRREKSYWIIVNIICIISIYCVVYYFPFVQSLDGDNAPQTYALYSYAAKAIMNGELPLWNSYVWGGISNINSPITEAFYPINWILGILFYNKNTATVSYAMIPANIFLHMVIYFVGMQLLIIKKQIKKIIAPVLALLSILSFSFSAYCMVHTWYSYLDEISWYPLIIFVSLNLILSTNIRNTVKNICILGALFGLEASISVGPTLGFIALSIVILFIVYGIRENKIKNRFARIFMAGGTGILFALPILLCVASFVTHCARYIDDFGGWIYGSEKLPYANFIAHKASIDDAMKMFDFYPSISWMSISGVLLIFAILGFFMRKNKTSLHIWTKMLFAYALLYCVAIFVTDFAYYIPVVNSMREPFMYGVFVNIYTTLLASDAIASIGIFSEETLIGHQEKLVGWRMLNSSNCVFSKVSICIILAIIIDNLLPINYKNAEKLGLVLVTLIMFVFSLGKFKKTAIAMFLVSSILYTQVYVGQLNFGKMTEQDAIQQVNDCVEYNNNVIKNINLGKEEKYLSIGNEALPLNWGSIVGYKDALAYMNPTMEILAKANTSLDFAQRSKLSNIKIFLVNQSNDDSLKDWFKEGYADKFKYTDTIQLLPSFDATSTENVDVYSSNVAGENGWVIYNSEIADYSDEDYVFNWINTTDLDLIGLINSRNLSEEEKNRISNINGDGEYNIDTIQDKNNKKEYMVTTSEEGIFIATDTFDTGWKVYVNGKKATLLNVDYTNRGVIVPAGENNIVFVYRPIGFTVGVIILAVFIVIACTWAFMKKRKDRKITKRSEIN